MLFGTLLHISKDEEPLSLDGRTVQQRLVLTYTGWRLTNRIRAPEILR